MTVCGSSHSVTCTASTDPAADPTAAGPTPTADPATASDDANSTDAGQVVPFTVDLDFVAAFVLVRGGEAAIVDTGVAGSEDAIEAVLAEAGIGWGAVGPVILPHPHGAHAGRPGAGPVRRRRRHPQHDRPAGDQRGR